MRRADDFKPTTYEIRLSGLLDARWAARFDGLVLRHEPDGITVLSGPITDQASLHGVLQQVRDLGITLVSVTRIDPDQRFPPGTAAGSAPLERRRSPR